jgi:O-antigen/teichoic acid export membrane protein
MVRTKFRDSVLSVAALAGYTTLINIDTFLANHFFTATMAGDYAAVAVAAHIAFFVPAALVTVAFPHLADGQGTSDTSRNVFRQTLNISVVMGLLAAVFMTALPRWTISLLFGAKYAEAATILGQLSFASVAVGVLILLVYLHLARRSLTALAPWLGVVVSVIAISIDHGSMASVAIIMLVVSILTMAAAAIPAVAWHRDR